MAQVVFCQSTPESILSFDCYSQQDFCLSSPIYLAHQGFESLSIFKYMRNFTSHNFIKFATFNYLQVNAVKHTVPWELPEQLLEFKINNSSHIWRNELRLLQGVSVLSLYFSGDINIKPD
jgi:hypothetical protein